MENSNKGSKVGFIIAMILCLIGIIYSAYMIFNGTLLASQRNLLALVNYVMVIFYALFFYSKPHGNALRYVYLLFAFNTGVLAGMMFPISPIACYTMMIAVVIVAFIAGRLNRLQQNNILGTIILILMIIASAVLSVAKFGLFQFTSFLVLCGPALQWIVIVCVYNCRYMLHKEAAFTEKK